MVLWIHAHVRPEFVIFFRQMAEDVDLKDTGEKSYTASRALLSLSITNILFLEPTIILHCPCLSHLSYG